MRLVRNTACRPSVCSHIFRACGDSVGCRRGLGADYVIDPYGVLELLAILPRNLYLATVLKGVEQVLAVDGLVIVAERE